MTTPFGGCLALRLRALAVLLIGCGVSGPAPAWAQATAAAAQQAKPVANAGPNQQIVVGATVLLDGSASVSGNGTPLAYDWNLVGRPAGSTASLTGADTVNPSFVPDVPGTYTVKLVVSAGKTKSKPDTVDVIARSNRAPVADAGPDQFVAQQSVVQLNGSASSDADGDALRYAWAIVSKPAGSAASLSDPSSASPTFPADISGTYDVRLVVDDGLIASAADTVRIIANTPPMANAGPAQTVFVNATVQLNGSGSSDVNGQSLTFSWTFQSRPAGSTATLSDAASVTPTFVADRAGTYVVRLLVNDGMSDSAPASVQVSTINSPPVARAGADQNVVQGSTVQLDGTASSDVDGDLITYAWVLTRPAGSAAVLSNPLDARPTFLADVAGTFSATLTVSDGRASSAPDQVTIVSARSNTRPVAQAGSPQSVPLGATVQLDGSRSSDIDGDSLTFAWSLTTRPAGSTAVPSDPALVNPTFVADRPGTYVAQLIVSDGMSSSDPATVMIVTTNSVPSANAGPDQTVPLGASVVLSGAGSSDPDGDALTYRWSLITRPIGSRATILDAAAPLTSFVADAAGLYVAQLIVNDGVADSIPDTVSISTQATPPVANAGTDQTGSVGAPVELDGRGSSDPDGDTLTYAWSLTVRPAGSVSQLSGPTTPQPTFVPDRTGTYVAQLIVSDGTFTSGPDTVTVTVGAGGGTPIADAGPDQSANIGATVQLDGRASTDPDGDQLSYSWSFVSKPTGSLAALAGATTATPTFVLDAPGPYEVQLVVSDGVHDSAADVVTIRANRPPLASAGPDQLLPLPSLPVTVQLDGSLSSDPDGDSLTYQWIFNSRPQGSVATLCPGGPSLDDNTCANARTIHPTFTADLAGTYELQLVVNDGKTNSASDVVRIKSSNVRPAADAGPDQRNVPQGTLVTLNGSGSSDPDGDELQYSWQLMLKPELSDAALVNPATVAPRFVIDRAGRYRVQLVVNDGLADSVADTVDITTPNIAPIANAGPDRSVSAGTAIALDGTNSSDADGDALTYQWTLISKPLGSSASLGNTGSARPSFTPDVTGAFVFELVVSDGIDTSTPDSVTITATTPGMALSLVDTTLIGVGRTSTLRISIPLPAPGLVVQVGSDNANVVSVGPPASVTFGVNQTQAQLTLNGVNGGVTTLHATASGYTEAILNVTVTPNLITLPVTGTVPLGQTASIPVTIAPSAAPAGGLVVSLASDNSSVVEILTPTITIAAGAFSANATIKGAAPGVTSIRASNPNYAGDDSVVTSTAEIDILQTSVAYTPGFPTSITVQLETGGVPTAAPAGSLSVTLTAANPACVAVQSPVVIPGGLVNATTPLTYGGTATLPCTTTVTGGGAGLTPDTVTVTVNPNPGITLSGALTTGAGLQRSTSGSLGFADHGGRTVRVASSDPTLFVVSRSATAAGVEAVDIPVPAGQITFSYYLQGIEGRTGSGTITATADGFTTGTAAVSVAQPALQIFSLPATTTTLSADIPFTIGIGLPNAQGTAMVEFLSVRGGSSVPVTVTSSNSAVGVLTTQTGTGAIRTVTIPAGASFSASAVSAGGIAFDPLTTGSTVVSATAPGVVAALPLSAVTLTVGNPGLVLNANSTNGIVGNSLQRQYLARLGGANHNGVTLRIESGNPAVALVSATATGAGAAFIEVPVANGVTDVSYYVQGADGATGSVTLTGTASGFTAGTQSVTIVQSAVLISGLQTSTTTLSADQLFQVGVGLPNAQGTSLIEYLNVRGGGGVTVTLTSSNSLVARLTTSAGTGASGTVSIAPNNAFSAGSVASGGIAFDPVGVGSTTVTATAPGFATALSLSAVTVSITGPGVTLNGFSASTTVGSSLQRSYTARLGGANHGGVTLRIASGDAARALVSPAATTAGTPFIDVPVANGTTDVPFYLQGADGGTGVVTVTASATGFSDGSQQFTIVQPAIQVAALPTSTTTLAADQPFQVLVGLPNAQGTGIIEFLNVRGGGSVTATVTTSAATVGALTTTAGTGASRTVNIPQNAFSSAGSVATGGIAFDPISAGTTTVAATAPGFATGLPISAVTVSITGPGITLNAFSVNTTVGSSLQRQYTAQLGGANHGGVTLRISSSNAAVALVSTAATAPGQSFIDITVPNGTTNVPYFLQGADGGTGTVTLTASATGFTSTTQAFTIAQSALQIVGLPASSTTLSPDQSFQVGVGLPNALGTAILEYLPVRGGGGVVVSLRSGTPAVALLTTSAGSAETGTVTIVPNSSFSAGSVAAGGIAFHPAGEGTTTITATSPGFAAGLAVSAAMVSVTAPSIALNVLSAPTVIGARLQQAYRGRLGAPAPAGGVTVRVEPSNSALALVSDSRTAVGQTFVNILVAAGTTDFIYYAQGVNGALGLFSIAASTQGFTAGTQSGSVVQPALKIEGLATSVPESQDTNVQFRVAVGIANTTNTDLLFTQEAAAGTNLVATVTNSNEQAAQLFSAAGAGQTRTALVPVGETGTRYGFTQGGIEFDPLDGGTSGLLTQVQAAIPGFITTTAGTVFVTVLPN